MTQKINASRPRPLCRAFRPNPILRIGRPYYGTNIIIMGFFPHFRCLRPPRLSFCYSHVRSTSHHAILTSMGRNANATPRRRGSQLSTQEREVSLSSIHHSSARHPNLQHKRRRHAPPNRKLGASCASVEAASYLPKRFQFLLPLPPSTPRKGPRKGPRKDNIPPRNLRVSRFCPKSYQSKARLVVHPSDCSDLVPKTYWLYVMRAAIKSGQRARRRDYYSTRRERCARIAGETARQQSWEAPGVSDT